MDSSALLDYALLQLTPTRTRCDLVVVAGGKTEKMASGLVEPFVSHLKFAKDQIQKGGYSITLRPPSPHASWFTKNTFLRFVRFVSTPEILGRSVRIEREILQIESSIQSNELSHSNTLGHEGEGCTSAADRNINKSANSSKLKLEVERGDGALEETSKFRLQRVLEARKALLQKEQAMAYARAIVAGFEMDLMDNLICFAEAFGASRLMEACMDFKELYKKKHTDGHWMEELAAMKASSLQDSVYMGTSGVILAYGNNDVGVPVGSAFSNGSSDAPSDLTTTQPNPDSTRDIDMAASVQTPLAPGKVQLQALLPNQIPQYMYHSQNQQIPPHPGYPFPNVHPLQPFYPGNPFWPQSMNNRTNANDQEFNNHRYHKSAQKKEKSSNASVSETSEDDEQTESSNSDSGAELDAVRKQDRKYSPRDKPHVKKHKKSSKTVVIRNINYITSKRRNGDNHGSDDSSSVEAISLDEVSIRREVDKAVASFKTNQDSKECNSNNSLHQGLDTQNGTIGYSDQDLTYNLNGKISNGEEKNENWSAFQILLSSRAESTCNGDQQKHVTNFQDENLGIHKSDDGTSFRATHAVDLGSEKDKMQQLKTDDSVLLTHSSLGSGGALDAVDFANGETDCTSMKKRDCEDMPLILKNVEESGGNSLFAPTDFASESTVIKNRRKDEDWFIVNPGGNLESEAKQIIFENSNTASFEGDSFMIEASKTAASIDDSFMVQSRPEVDDQYDSQWRTDISTIVDWNGEAIVADSKLEISRINEPDDLCVVLARDDQSEPTGLSWTPEMEDIYITETDKKSIDIEPKTQAEDKLPVNGKRANTKSNGGPTIRISIKDARSKVLQESLAKSKKMHPTSRLDVKKSKLEKEEEVRKRMEELAIQRQKRIAERTAASGSTPAASKRVPGGCKSASSKLEKHSPHAMLVGTKTLSSSKGAKIR